MNPPATVKWIGLALLGLAIAAGVAIAASSLASQQIGLASEPISAGDALAPASREVHGEAGQRHAHRRHPTPSPTTTTEATPPETVPTPPGTTTAPSTTEAPPSAPPRQPGAGGSEGKDDYRGGGSNGGGGADD